MKVVAYVPMKLNNERLPNKNTKLFDSGKPLYHHILETLTQVDNIDEIYVYCSSSEIRNSLPKGIKYLTRSQQLDRSETKINEVMLSFANDVDADIYVLAHATAPFISAESITRAISDVTSGNYDSALSVVKVQEFLWKENTPYNYDTSAIPRTQDLEPLYAETTGLYVYKKHLITEKNRRIGIKPSLIEVSKIEAVDINEPVDFAIANAIDAHRTQAKR